jgi:hypothetical protein
MALYPAPFVARLKARGIAWWAYVSTLAEARAAEAAGADAVVVQGMEAGGHRGCFEASRADAGMVGLFSLIPVVADDVLVLVIATGGIADGRGPDARCLGRPDRHWLPAVPRGKHPSGMGGRLGPDRAGGHDGDPGLQRPRGQEHRDGVRARRR